MKLGANYCLFVWNGLILEQPSSFWGQLDVSIWLVSCYGSTRSGFVCFLFPNVWLLCKLIPVGYVCLSEGMDKDNSSQLTWSMTYAKQTISFVYDVAHRAVIGSQKSKQSLLKVYCCVLNITSSRLLPSNGSWWTMSIHIETILKQREWIFCSPKTILNTILVL